MKSWLRFAAVVLVTFLAWLVGVLITAVLVVFVACWIVQRFWH